MQVTTFNNLGNVFNMYIYTFTTNKIVVLYVLKLRFLHFILTKGNKIYSILFYCLYVLRFIHNTSNYKN